MGVEGDCDERVMDFLSRREMKTQGSYNYSDCCVQGGTCLFCSLRGGALYSFWFTLSV